MCSETQAGFDTEPAAINGYASFWDEPEPAAPLNSADSSDAYAAFAVAADL